MAVVCLEVGVNGLLAITLCSEASWHTNGASNYLNLKTIFLFPLLTHTEGRVERDKQQSLLHHLALLSSLSHMQNEADPQGKNSI